MSHYKALMKKNFILWKRNSCWSLLEILFPVLFASLLFIFRSQIDTIDLNDTSYINQRKAFSSDVIANTKMKNCTFGTEDDKRRGFIGLAPQNQITVQLANIFSSFNYKPKYFHSTQEMMDYVTGPDYEEDLCLGKIHFISRLIYIIYIRC